MAELDIGLHCNFSNCNQLDFLPFRCDHCAKVYCLNHRSITAHSCAAANRTVEVPDTVSNKISYKCSLDICEKTELLQILCSSCEKKFCVVHRLPEDHQCTSRRKASSPSPYISSVVLKKDNSLLAKYKKVLNPKQQRLAAKIALMKLKQVAIGDKNIPGECRVFFSVKRPKHDKDLHIFVSEKWTFGQLLDKAANISGISNSNNESFSKKIMLRCHDSDTDLDPGMNIKDAIHDTIVFSGSALELYVSDT